METPEHTTVERVVVTRPLALRVVACTWRLLQVKLFGLGGPGFALSACKIVLEEGFPISTMSCVLGAQIGTTRQNSLHR